MAFRVWVPWMPKVHSRVVMKTSSTYPGSPVSTLARGLWMKVVMALKMLMPVTNSKAMPMPDTTKVVMTQGKRMAKDLDTSFGTFLGILISIFPLLTRRQ